MKIITLRPFFSFYGSKWRIAPKYPAPQFDTIIEPFAGSAGYSVRHYQRSVILYDVDPKICGVWDYIIRSPERDILSLPINIDSVDDAGEVCQEARWLIGFWMNRGTSQPRVTRSSWGRIPCRKDQFWGHSIRNRIATQARLIRHWRVFNVSWEQIPIIKTETWFVDPPYQDNHGRYYKYNRIDYPGLGDWVKGLPGQAIVCESENADWLPFEKFVNARSRMGRSQEMIWTNGPIELQTPIVELNQK